MHGLVGKAGRGMLMLALLPVGERREPVEMLTSTLTALSTSSVSTDSASPCRQDARNRKNDAIGATIIPFPPVASACFPSPVTLVGESGLSAEVLETLSDGSKLAAPFSGSPPLRWAE